MTEFSPEVLAAAAEVQISYEHGTATLRDYLKDLLRTVWVEEEGFSGKRPFGNSSWQHNVYAPLVKAGLVAGVIDTDGYVERMDDRGGDDLVKAVIEYIFKEDA